MREHKSTKVKHNFLQVLEEEICTFIIPSESIFQDVLGKSNTLRKTKQYLEELHSGQRKGTEGFHQ